MINQIPQIRHQNCTIDAVTTDNSVNKSKSYSLGWECNNSSQTKVILGASNQTSKLHHNL